MDRSILVGSQLIVGLNGSFVTTWVGCAGLKEDVALPAKCLAFFGCSRVALKHFVIQSESVFRFSKLALDHRLFVASRPAHRAILLHDLVEKNECPIQGMLAHARHG